MLDGQGRNVEDFGKIVTAFGWPGAMLIAIVVFLWRLLVRLDRVFLDTEKGVDGRPKGWAVRAFYSLEENSVLQSKTLLQLEQESKHKEEMLKELRDGQHEIILVVDRIEERVGTGGGTKTPPRTTG